MPDEATTGSAGFSATPLGRGNALPAAGLEDPVVRSGRREALWTLGLWLAATVYSVTYCTLWGYARPVESLSFVLWFPDWVFWGVVMPWGTCTVVSIYFALYMIEDDPLCAADDAPSEDAPPDAPSPNSAAMGREAGGD